MESRHVVDAWSSGDSYEPYVGRWSRLVAAEFVRWLGIPLGADWLDVGCGTGALTAAILRRAAPLTVLGVDPAPRFIEFAAAHTDDARVRFEVRDAAALGVADESVDVVVSGLVLNFVPDRGGALREMCRVVRPGGVVAGYVWDYPDGMQLMKYFWDTAVELDPAANALHEGVRFGFCRPDPLAALFTGAALTDVEVRAIVVPTVFADFDDYWSPFLGGQAPGPSYVASLDDVDRLALRDALRARLPVAADGSIHLTARAWAVRGHRQDSATST